MSARTDSVRTIRDSKDLVLSGLSNDGEGEPMMLASGRLRNFTACYGRLKTHGDGTASLDAASAALLGIAPGDSFVAIGR